MERHDKLLLLLALGGFLSAGCGGDDAPAGPTCGAGTVELNGMCVPNGMACGEGAVYDPATHTCVAECEEGQVRRGSMCVDQDDLCGTGTRLVGDACVPDGSVVCQGNTIFDAETGGCVQDPAAICSGDLVYVEAQGACVDPDTLLPSQAEVQEGAEPNGPGAAMPTFGTLNLDDGSTSVYGCNTPSDWDGDGTVDSDMDVWTFSVDGPTLLDVSATGLNFNPGVAFISSVPQLSSANWIRFITSFASTRPDGKVFLPAAGEYTMLVDDARTFWFGEVAGGGSTDADACYFLQLETAELPAATPLTPGTVQDGTLGDPAFYSYTLPSGLLNIQYSELVGGAIGSNAATNISLTVLVNGMLHTSISGSNLDSMFYNLPENAQILVAAEASYVNTLTPAMYRLNSRVPTITPLVTGENMATHHASALTENLTKNQLEVFSFNATAGDVLHLFSGRAGGSFDFQLWYPSGQGLTLCGNTATADGCPTSNRWFEVQQTGTHYFFVYNWNGTDGQPYAFDAVVHTQTPVPLTAGAVASAMVEPSEPRFFSFNPSEHTWAQFGHANAMGFTTLQDAFVSQSTVNPLLPLNIDAVVAVPGDGVTNRSFSSMATRGYIALTGNGTTAASADLLLREAIYTDLGVVHAEAPAARSMVAATGIPEFYVVRGDVAGENMTINVSSTTADVSIVRYTLPTVTAGTAVNAVAGPGTERVTLPVVNGGVTVVFAVRTAAAGGTFDVTVTSAPPPYIAAESMVPFASVCPANGGAGQAVALSDNDDGLAPATLPEGFGFELFGNPVSGMTIDSNGMVTFNAIATSCWSPTFGACATQRNVIAPFWRDLANVTACTHHDGDRFVIEWRGTPYNGTTAVAVQAVLHSNGVIDFVWAPTHATALSTGFTGLRNGDGTLTLSTPPANYTGYHAITYTPNP